MKAVFAGLMLVAVVSFIGFCVENAWMAYSQGVVDNRDMCLPFLLGYGLAILAVYILFGVPQRPLFFGRDVALESKAACYVYYFVAIGICVSVGEIVMGKVIEKISGYQWWDYTSIPLHITQYTSVPTSVGFSALIFVFMRYCFDPIMNCFMRMEMEPLRQMSIMITIGLFADMFYNLHYIFKHGEGKKRWCIDIRMLKEKII